MILNRHVDAGGVAHSDRRLAKTFSFTRSSSSARTSPDGDRSAVKPLIPSLKNSLQEDVTPAHE